MAQRNGTDPTWSGAQLAGQRGVDRAMQRSRLLVRNNAADGHTAATVLSVAAHVAVLLILTYAVVSRIVPQALPTEETVALVFQATPAPTPPAPAAEPPKPALITPAPPEQPLPVAQPEPATPEPPPPPQTREARLPPPVWLTPPKPHVANNVHTIPMVTHAPEAAVPVAFAQPAVSEAVIPPHPVAGMETNRAPVYPESSRRRGEQGRVMLRVSVSATGAPLEVDVLTSSGHPMLDSAALAAVRGWRFIPATQGGSPVVAVADVPIRFELDN